jgi:indolepyruvate ferredoxin oxidoreductase alpha subunit
LDLTQLFEDDPGKKVLMSGNEAFARGICESGVRFSANYPGTPLSEVGDYLNQLSKISNNFIFDYSLNEKVALESCIGASWAGLRSVVMFKHLGLNVAADPLHTFPYSGVNGGMLILCGGDPDILSSTNAQDNRLYSLHTKIPIIEPATVQECKDYIREGLRISELYQIPVYVHVTTRLCHSYGIVTLDKIENNQTIGFFKKDPSRYVNTLTRALTNQFKYFEKIAQIAKNKKLFYLMNKEKLITKDKETQVPEKNPIGIVTSGTCYSYVIQACHKLGITPPILKLGLIFPINRDEVCAFASKYDLTKLLVVEELEPFIETFSKRVFCNHCDSKRNLEVRGKEFLPTIGELDTDIIMKFFAQYFTIKDPFIFDEIQRKEQMLEKIIPTLAIREPTFCPACQYRPVFYALKKVTDEIKKNQGFEFIYAGDIGCYTLSEAYPYQLIDWVICMGAGIGIANGMAYAIDPKKQKIIAYVGDSTLFHSGLQPLFNAVKNEVDLTIIVFKNDWTAMTGHQVHAGTPRDIINDYSTSQKTDVKSLDLIKILESLSIRNLVITDAYNVDKLIKLFSNTLILSGVKIIVINEECALEKGRRIRRSNLDRNVKKREIYYTITDSCVKCNECIDKLGCPAINVEYEAEGNEAVRGKSSLRYYIDEARCDPYTCDGVCKSLCKNNSIRKTMINPPLKSE